MAKLDEEQLKKQIKSREFSNAYFIWGEESYLKEYYVSKLKQEIVDPSFEAFNFHSFDGKGAALDDILKDADMLPMMSEYNFVLVRDYPFEASKKDVDDIKEFLSDVPQSCIIVFWYDTVEVNLKKSARFKAVENAFAKYGSSVNLEKRSEMSVAKMLVSGAKKRGAVLDLNNAKYLITVAGNDLKTLLNEIDKLAYFCKGGEITKDVIDNMAVKCLQARIYDLSKFIVAGNTDSAFSILDTLFAMKEEPIIILSTISGVYVDMYRVKCAKISGKTYDNVAKHFNYKGREFTLKNASRDCAKLTSEQLRLSLDTLLQTDKKLKSTSVNQRLLLEELIIKLVMIAGEKL